MTNIVLSRFHIISILSFLWLLLTFFGSWQVWRYDNRPGTVSAAPTRWPEKSALKHNSYIATLMMVIHPHCPCSRASLVELAHLMARSQGRLSATVIFVQYQGVTQHWVQTDTWRQAAAIPGVHVLSDLNGRLAHRLGAETSGQTYVYDGQGRLLFCGGLTRERGMEGDNAGLRAMLALICGRSLVRTTTPVFGCPLFPQEQSTEEEPLCKR